MESFLGSFSFLGFLWNMLCYPQHTHTSPLPSGEGRSKHTNLGTPGGVGVSLLLRLCGGAELTLCLPQKYFMVMIFPFNNLPFPPLHVLKWKSRGEKKKFKPIAQDLGASACLGALFVTVTIQCLDDVSGERCWMLLWPRENVFLLPCPIFVGRARSAMELTWEEGPEHAWSL